MSSASPDPSSPPNPIPTSCPSCPSALTYTGTLDYLPFFEITPIIGREYPTANIRSILRAPNAEAQIRDFAVVISQRGVVFLRDQHDLSVADQKKFTDLLGRLSGRPEDHGLHVHPLFRDPGNARLEDGSVDENIYVINSDAQKRLYKTMAGRSTLSEPRDPAREWHSDSTFETAPADYSFLKMLETPPHGGDTLWASGYEVYDRISPSFRSYLETLTATCAQPVFASAAAAGGYDIMSPRGSPLNDGTAFAPAHPVVRTNRVTRWKAVFAGAGLHVSRINGVYAYEDQMIREYVLRLVTRSHDCVARMKWTRNAAAIWDNSCVWHAATPDTGLVEGRRVGVRASSVGEVPFLEPGSRGRREGLGLAAF